MHDGRVEYDQKKHTRDADHKAKNDSHTFNPSLSKLLTFLGMMLSHALLNKGCGMFLCFLFRHAMDYRY